MMKHLMWVFFLVHYSNALRLVPLSEFNITNSAAVFSEGEDFSICDRECEIGDVRNCYYKFYLEHYHAMGPACGECANGVSTDCLNLMCVPGDGVERGVMSVNRQIPGPPIFVCRDDMVIVDVINAMDGTATTIHWHGMQFHEEPFMDGAPFITQCPIDFASTFRYKFSASQAGSMYWHSIAGHHKTNGIYGGLVIRESRDVDIHTSLYDYDLSEHLIVVSDWMHDVAEQFVPGLPTRGVGLNPSNFLINGLGQHVDNTYPRIPLKVFRVEQGNRYRFRYINSATFSCTWSVQIEQHNLQVIATDSYNVEPEIFDTFYSHSGERYDFILNAIGRKQNYWIKMRSKCALDEQVEQYAILSYYTEEEMPIETFANMHRPRNSIFIPRGRILNYPMAWSFAEADSFVTVADLEAAEKIDNLETETPAATHIFKFNNYALPKSEVFVENNYAGFYNTRNDVLMLGAINNISLSYPSFSILTQPNQAVDSAFCDDENRPTDCVNHFCQCLHRVKLEKDVVVEIILVDESTTRRDIHHSFHLHGYSFSVIFTGHCDELGTVDCYLDETQRNARFLSRETERFPPQKDTLAIPSAGFAVLRIRTNNPGFWMLHSNYDWHAGFGMGLIIQVGETNDFKPAPSDFPQCNAYTPDYVSL